MILHCLRHKYSNKYFLYFLAQILQCIADISLNIKGNQSCYKRTLMGGVVKHKRYLLQIWNGTSFKSKWVKKSNEKLKSLPSLRIQRLCSWQNRLGPSLTWEGQTDLISGLCKDDKFPLTLISLKWHWISCTFFTLWGPFLSVDSPSSDEFRCSLFQLFHLVRNCHSHHISSYYKVSTSTIQLKFYF